MAKRKGRRTTRKKRNDSSSFLTEIKRMIIAAVLVVLCFILLLYAYNYFCSPDSDKGNERVKKEKVTAEMDAALEDRGKETISPSDTKTFRIPAGLELPRLTVNRQEQIIKHEGYTVSYNSNYCIANWVAYELTSQEAKSSKNERYNKFVPDPMVEGATAYNEDYTRTGFDRGHMAPAGDMKWSAKAMRESFYFSNICPQKPGLNRGIWEQLEEQCRLWAKDNGSLLIVAGPVITENMRRMGKDRIGVPQFFYKVLCYRKGKTYEGIGFLFENRDYGDTKLESMAVPIDSVEKVTGIDFFPALPDSEENKMEATIDWSSWSF
ncbi:MAG: DNA/RNA non-specific endonuclease [Parabacteroides sp.]|nr:DNA/RNA non-specific endonuclease [Parabacteroides sp.]